ncbi:MAG: hypothetical protein H0T75_25090, partial [Rhizobiales bacterium]|nr:hypothetical protein [Hyphomicrobiales bacterium]
MKATRIVQVFLVGTILALVVAGLFTSAIIRERQIGLDKVLGYNFAFDANQAVIELLRLDKALLNFANDRTQQNLEAVRLRFEIMYNRVQLFGEGEFKTYIQGGESRRQVYEAFKGAAHTLDPILTPAGPNLAVEPLRKLLAPLERDLLGFASEANRHMAARAAGDHEALVRLHWRFSGLMFGLIISGLLLVAVLSWNSRLLKRAHGDLKH